MRVLHVINTLLFGGAEVLLCGLVPRLCRQGIECEVYVLRSHDTPLEGELKRKGVKIYAPLKRSVYSPLHVSRLADHLRSHTYDLVHVHLFPSQLWVALAARISKSGAPLVTTEHNAYSGRRPGRYQLIDRWMYSHYQQVACVSQASADAFRKRLPHFEGRIRKCINGINPDGLESRNPEDKPALFSLPSRCAVILSVGRLERVKDHRTTIHALSLVPEVQVFIAGAGSMLRELQEFSRDLGVGDRVHFMGQRDDVPRLMAAADVFVQSSLFEGAPIATLEAMASGLPVVASGAPGLVEMVGAAGLLFDVGDYERLAAHLTSILHSGSEWTRVADACKNRAQSFDIDRTVDCYERFYRESLGERVPAPQEKQLVGR
jgi:glycosyltransferase involved in cell wall biosynthesis